MRAHVRGTRLVVRLLMPGVAEFHGGRVAARVH